MGKTEKGLRLPQIGALHGPFQIRLLQNISNADLVFALAGGGVERLAGGKHYGVALVVKLLQQPFLERIGIVHRQRRHDSLLIDKVAPRLFGPGRRFFLCPM